MPKIRVQSIAKLTGHQGSIYTLARNDDSHTFFSGSGDGTVVKWDLNDLSTAKVIAKVGTNIFSLERTPGTPYLLAGQLQGGIHVLDIGQKKEIKHLALHKNGVFDIRVISDRFYAAGGDGLLSVWSTEDFSFIKSVKLSTASLRAVDFDLEKNIMAAGSSDNNIYLLDMQSLKVVHTLGNHDNSVFTVRFSPGGKYLLAGSRDAQISVWKAGKNYELYRLIPAHLFTVNSIAYSPDGQLFATASRDKTIKIWDAATFELLKVIENDKIPAHVNSVNSLLWMGHKNYLVSCSDDRSVMVWQVEVQE